MHFPQKAVCLLLLSCTSVQAFTTGAFLHHKHLRTKKSLQDTKLFVKTNAKLTPAQRAIQKQKEEETPSQFDKAKVAFYATVDTVKDANKEKPSPEVIKDGYSDVVKATPAAKKVSKPKTVPKPKTRSTPVKSRGTTNMFDSMKGAIYGSIDAASSSLKKDDSKAKAPVVESLPVISENLQDTFLSPVLLKELEPELNSDNIFKKFAGQIKLKNLERKEMTRIKKLEARQKVREIKETAYNIVDSIQETSRKIQAIPGQVSDFTQKSVAVAQSIPVKTQEAVDTVVSIPDKVQAKAHEVQENVDATVSKTKQAIDDVKALPDKIQERAVKTQQGLLSASEAVKEGATSAKVLLGLEKAKPKPPKMPPPPPKDPSVLDVSVAVVTAVASGAGKALFWVTKGLAGAALEPVKRKKDDSPKSQLIDSIPETPPTEMPRKTIEDPDLDLQVRQALQLAADALDAVAVDEETTKEKKTP